MTYLKKQTLLLILIPLIFGSCAIFKENKTAQNDGYVYCPMQNVQLVQTGDEELDKINKKNQLKYTKNRKAFLLFFTDLRKELDKEDIDKAEILKHFDRNSSISYANVSSQKPIHFINYLEKFPDEDKYALERLKCGGKHKFRISLRCRKKKERIIWWFTYNSRHKIKSFKETTEVYQP